jgi:transposase
MQQRHVRATGKLVPDRRSVTRALSETVRKILKKTLCGHMQLRETQADKRQDRGGNVSIGMIRKRARGIRDTEYFKLKIRQSSIPDNQSMFYLKS